MPKLAAKPPKGKGRGWLRIIGGAWRGRKIAVPDTNEMRPTNERAREAIFNRLMHAESLLGVRLKGAAVADLFAGTGALGLEALSRGAKSAVFVERNGDSCRAIMQTLQTLDAEDRAEVILADATALGARATALDLILLDPPYGKDLIGPTLASLRARGWAKLGTLLVVETETAIELPAGYELIDQRQYGRATIAFITVRA